MTRTGTNVRPGQALAVVVGAGGIAMAIARRLGDDYRILLADRDGDHLERQVAALRAEGHDAAGVVCDVIDPAAVANLASLAADSGPVRAVVHVVGLSPSMADSETVLRVNLIGPTLVAEAFVELAEQGTAAVFISSLAAHMGPLEGEVVAALDDPLAGDFVAAVTAAYGAELTSTAAYQLTKAAMLRMCERQAARWGRRGARIVSVSPGLIASPMGALEFEARPDKVQLLDATPLGREGTMIEIADAVAFLVSERASFISGVDLLVDGGVRAALRHPPG